MMHNVCVFAFLALSFSSVSDHIFVSSFLININIKNQHSCMPVECDHETKRISKINFLCSLQCRESTLPLNSIKTKSKPYRNENLEYTLIDDIQKIPESIWDNCITELSTKQISSPFLQHAFLSALESSGCASSETGWLPRHLQITKGGTACAFVPLYIKGHSMGEFIFDSEWADYAKQKGVTYYPKVLIGSPFSPITCPKILIDPSFYESHRFDEDKERLREFRLYVGEIIQSIVKGNRLSSAHMNFLTEEEATDLAGEFKIMHDDENNVMTKSKYVLQSMVQKLTTKESNFIRKATLQYHWFNKHKERGDAYHNFDDYLKCFKSKKRISIKRERRRVAEQNIRVDAIVGKEIRNHPGLVKRMYEIYKSTVDKKLWGNLYFTLEFFEMLVDKDNFVNNLVFMCARPSNFNNTDTSTDSVPGVFRSDTKVDRSEFKAQDVFAGTINVVQNGIFYGRFYGTLNEVKNIHFEVR